MGVVKNVVHWSAGDGLFNRKAVLVWSFGAWELADTKRVSGRLFKTKFKLAID